MKKIVTFALLASAAIASPAMAQSTTVTGTINITGTVQAKCFVSPGNGDSFGTPVGTSVVMGELSQSDGTLKPTGTLSSTFATVGGTALTAQVICTSANPSVSVLSEPLVNSVAADPGYDNSVDYTADVTFTRVGGTSLVSDASAIPAPTTATLPSRLTGTGTNISVATSGWTASGVLVAGSYAGKITIVVAPGV